MYQHIREKGLLISEYPLGTSPRREHFPFRNRIMAALASKVIVCQASEKSGTMLTVNEALELGKDIYVVPYRITDSEGRGCNSLIQQGANIIVL
ncbi:MAG: DNA-processing protein DprA [Erysipelotrichaceae bacterium]|nr:DNA-processing protein DprA [Erysipelotrichaceae bacterium]